MNTMTIAGLRARRAELVAEAEKAVAESNYSTDEDGGLEGTKADTRIEQVNAIDKQIRELEMSYASKAATAKPIGTAGFGFSTGNYATPKQDHKLKAFKSVDDAYKAGMWLCASFAKDSVVRDQALNWCQANGMPQVVKYQSENLNTAGGFLVPTEFNSAIVDLREEFGTFRANARVVPMSSDSMTMPRRASGLTAYYVGENAQITESQKGWDSLTLVAKKLACLTRISTELTEDAAINVAEDLAREMAYAFAVAEDAAGWNGDGTSTYGGIQGVKPKFVAGLGSYVGAVDLTSGHDTIAEVDAADIAKVMQALPRYARRNAKFFMSQQMFDGAFQRLIAAAGGNSTMTMDRAVPLSYLGYPIVIDQTLPIGGTINDVPAWYFGDLSLAVKLGSRRDIRVMISADRYMEFDQIGIQATERFDIIVHDIGDATAAGPIVAAMGNS